MLFSNQWRAAHVQARPDFLKPAALADPRIRKALALAIDKAGVNQLIYSGEYAIADSIFSPASEMGKAADAALTKYPFDLQKSAQMLAEAGFNKDSGGSFTNASGKLSFEVKTNGATDNESEMSAIASGWRQAFPPSCRRRTRLPP